MGDGGNQVSWCAEGYYLEDRPQFTFDPLLHAGCYYVQEASSMFVTHVVRSVLSPLPPKLALDLCAAPGGKSTALRSVLPEECVLVSNEPMGNRAQILLENITKWGAPNCIVTNNYPRDFRRAKLKFDLILCDVPCSGEGMMRKDPGAISEWSLKNVEKCWQLQREIVADAWECLNPGGLFIYSTCTFNTKENEENIQWMLDNFDAEVLDIPVDPSWQITGSLLEGFNAPVYRFIPGITRGEGLFVCALRKAGSTEPKPFNAKKLSLKVLEADFPKGDVCVDLDYPEAIKYLRGEAMVLPSDTPKGIVEITYKGQPIGPVKNIGNRANNLYPKPWRIKSTHLPSEAPEVLGNVKM
jgi:16S rRNA C967 or C1407 C5-methylase (RsmB/RsmF family)